MQLKQIVFATDFSSSSDAALRLATMLARDSRARLLIVHVSEPRPAYTVAGVYASLPVGNEFAESNERLLKVLPTDSQVPCEHRLLIGVAADEIVKFAKESGADLIVIGSHGRTGLRRLLVGSVAEAVVRQAECPVITIKTPEELPTGA